MSDARPIPATEVRLPDPPRRVAALLGPQDIAAWAANGAAVLWREHDGQHELDGVGPEGTAQPVHLPTDLGAVQALAISPEGEHGLVADRRRVLRFALAGGEPEVLFEAEAGDAVLSAATLAAGRSVVLTLGRALLLAASGEVVAEVECPPGTLVPGPKDHVLVETGAAGVRVLRLDAAGDDLVEVGRLDGARLAHVVGGTVYGRTDSGWVRLEVGTPEGGDDAGGAEVEGETEVVVETEVEDGEAEVVVETEVEDGEGEVVVETEVEDGEGDDAVAVEDEAGDGDDAVEGEVEAGSSEIAILGVERGALEIPEIPATVAARFGPHAWVHVSESGRHVALTCQDAWIYDRVAFLDGETVVHRQVQGGQLRTLNVRNDGGAALFGDGQRVWEVSIPAGETRLVWAAPEPGICGVHYVAEDLFGVASASMMWLIEAKPGAEPAVIGQAPINDGVGVVSALDGKALAVLTRGPESLLVFGVDPPRLKLLGTVTAALVGAESTARHCYVYDRGEHAFELVNVAAAWRRAFR